MIVAPAGFACFGGKHGDAVVDAVLQCQRIVVEVEIPADGVKIIFFADEVYLQIVHQDVGNLVEPFEAAIAVNNGFCASERCS